MQLMHNLPIIYRDRSPLTHTKDIKSKLQFVVDIVERSSESCFRYGPVSEKINEPNKIISLCKENGFDYFSPAMKYRG